MKVKSFVLVVLLMAIIVGKAENIKRVKEIQKYQKYYSRYDTLVTKFYYDTLYNVLQAKKTYKNGIKYDSVSYVYSNEKIIESFYNFQQGRAIHQRVQVYKLDKHDRIVEKISKLYQEKYIYEEESFDAVIENNKDDSPIYKYSFERENSLISAVTLSMKNGLVWDKNNYQRYHCVSQNGKLSKIVFQNKVNKNWKNVKVFELNYINEKIEIIRSLNGKNLNRSLHSIDTDGYLKQEEWYNSKGELLESSTIEYEMKEGNEQAIMKLKSAKLSVMLGIIFLRN